MVLLIIGETRWISGIFIFFVCPCYMDHVDAFPEPFTKKWFFRGSVFYLILSGGKCFFYLAFSPFWASFAESVFFYFLLSFGFFSRKVFFNFFLPFFRRKRQFSVAPTKKGHNPFDKIRLPFFKWQMKKGCKNGSFNNPRNAMDTLDFYFFQMSTQMRRQNHLQKSGFLEVRFL